MVLFRRLGTLCQWRQIKYDDLKQAVEQQEKEEKDNANTNGHVGTRVPGYLKTLLPSHLFQGHNVDYLHSIALDVDEKMIFTSSTATSTTFNNTATSAAGNRGRSHVSQMYKYLVVLIGGSNAASADHLASMMLVWDRIIISSS